MSASPIDSPARAVRAMCARCAPVTTELVSIALAPGRILARPIAADRGHPAATVSAMDGYAVRAAEVAPGLMAVGGESRIGHGPPSLGPARCVKVMTGGPIPDGADAVIKREDVEERPGQIIVPSDLAVTPWQHVRRAGENAMKGAIVVEAGSIVSPAVMSAAATFGVARMPVHRRVRVAILTTGDEILPVTSTPSPWQIRDSNSWAVRAMLALAPWVEIIAADRCADDPDSLTAAVADALTHADALVMTGGVSMGDYDFAPGVLRGAGVDVLFHRLPQRPGRPMLGGVGPRGQVVFGLPGNPMSVMVTARRIALPVLAHAGGMVSEGRADPTTPVRLQAWTGEPLRLWWHRPVRLVQAGLAELVRSKGSHDIVGAAVSDGFVEIPPGERGEGPWSFRFWSG